MGGGSAARHQLGMAAHAQHEKASWRASQHKRAAALLRAQHRGAWHHGIAAASRWRHIACGISKAKTSGNVARTSSA